MNVPELLGLTRWVTEEIEVTQIPQKYKALQTILQQNSQPNQPQQPLETQKNDLIESLKTVPLHKLTKHQELVLHELGISNAVGEEGVGIIEDILYKNVIDVATSAQKLQQILDELNNGIKQSNQIKAGLEGIVLKEEYESEDEVLIRVSFTGQATMSNVTDFKKWGNIWHEIGRGIAMAHNASPEDVKIVGATNGSIIIEVATFASIATTVAGIILAALKVAEKVLDIKLKAGEIRNLKLKNKKLAADMEKEAENEKKTGTEEISTDIVKQLKLNKDTQGDKINALEKAVKNLVDFIESGGEVDFAIPEEAESDENEAISSNFGNLRITYQEIRLLDGKIKLLESSGT